MTATSTPRAATDQHITGLRRRIDAAKKAEAVSRAAADQLVAEHKTNGIDPTKNPEAFAEVDAAYDSADYMRDRVTELTDELTAVLAGEIDPSTMTSAAGQGTPTAGDWTGIFAAQTLTDADAGGVLLSNPIVSGIVDRLRTTSVVRRAVDDLGGTFLTIGERDARIPQLTDSTTAAMVAEGANITDTSLTVDDIAISAKKAAVLTRLTNETLRDLTNVGTSLAAGGGRTIQSIRELIAHDHLHQLATLLDVQYLTGDGTGTNMLACSTSPASPPTTPAAP